MKFLIAMLTFCLVGSISHAACDAASIAAIQTKIQTAKTLHDELDKAANQWFQRFTTSNVSGYNDKTVGDVAVGLKRAALAKTIEGGALQEQLSKCQR